MDPSADATPATSRTDLVNRAPERTQAQPSPQPTGEDRVVLGGMATRMLHPTLPPEAMMRLQLTYGRDQRPPLAEQFSAAEYLGELLGVRAAVILARG